MATKKDQPAEGTSPLLESIDPRQAAAGGLTSTPDEGPDPRDPTPVPDPKDNPAAPDDESNVVDPADPMTLTGSDATPPAGPPKK